MTDGNFIATVVAGGTVSALGGGKFVNGAYTAAFGYLYNNCAGWGTSCLLERSSKAIQAGSGLFIAGAGVFASGTGVFTTLGVAMTFYGASNAIEGVTYFLNEGIDGVNPGKIIFENFAEVAKLGSKTGAALYHGGELATGFAFMGSTIPSKSGVLEFLPGGRPMIIPDAMVTRIEAAGKVGASIQIISGSQRLYETLHPSPQK